MYDTTLRDGSQGEGVSFSVEDKVKIVKKLDELGFDYIEGGWPGSNPKDVTFFEQVKDVQLKNARVAAFGSTRKPGARPEEDHNLQCLAASGAQTATIFGKSWDFHVYSALETTEEENLKMIEDSVSYLREKGCTVFYDAEHFFDGYKANPKYALTTLKAALKGGAARIILCDTNGGTMPGDIVKIINAAAAEVSVPLGIHCHNDSELAVANSMTAVQAGVLQVQGTINGYGERCGNANLCSLIPNLSYKYDYDTIPQKSIKRMTELSRFVSELANMHPPGDQPYVGVSAFAHKGGIHVSALQKHPGTYEHIDPELVGNSRRVLVSELSGMSNLFYKYRELNLEMQGEEGRRVLEEIKDLENQGYQFEGADGSFDLRLRKAFKGYQEPFKLDNLRIILEFRENQLSSEAVIKMTVGDKEVHTASEGNGPVNALDNALRKALNDFFPEIKDMQLTDYKVRVLDGKDGTGAIVRVLVETSDGHKNWGTVGVSTNIIEASWQALVDSIAYGLIKKEEENNS
ncbi:MAG: citramalate synthase [Clostridiales bacterium]|nr:citramalate synthase [Clostridiales bacterium]MCF8022449.1 citramalate synthase [Clostridiales bacterium]